MTSIKKNNDSLKSNIAADGARAVDSLHILIRQDKALDRIA
jgi:hypothetical protein